MIKNINLKICEIAIIELTHHVKIKDLIVIQLQMYFMCIDIVLQIHDINEKAEICRDKLALNKFTIFFILKEF